MGGNFGIQNKISGKEMLKELLRANILFIYYITEKKYLNTIFNFGYIHIKINVSL
jgi:hypothetical protein